MNEKEESGIGEERFWVSVSKFDELLRDNNERSNLVEALLMLENHGVAVRDVYAERCVGEKDLDPIAVPAFNAIKDAIKNGEVLTFSELFEKF